MTMEFRNRSYFEDLIVHLQDPDGESPGLCGVAEWESDVSGHFDAPLLPEPPNADGEDFFFDPES